MVQFKDENGNWVKAAEDYAYSWGQAGMVVQFAGAASKVPPHWLLCDGSEYDCSAYPNLFNAIGYMYGGSGSKFKVPDYRECALVGAGENGTDTMEAHDVYDVGEFKDDQLQDHMHAGCGGSSSSGYPYRGDAYTFFNMDPLSTAHDQTETVGGTWINPRSTERYGMTTRGKRKGINYIIHV